MVKKEEIREKGFWDGWLDHKRKVKLEKIKQKTDFNNTSVWNTTVITILGTLVIILVVVVIILGIVVKSTVTDIQKSIGHIGNTYGTFAIAASDAIGPVATATGGVLEKNPELGALAIAGLTHMDEDTTFKLTALTLLKQVSGEANVDGKFTMHFPTVIRSYTEKADPRCRDEFEYHTTLQNNLILNQKMIDEGCNIFTTTTSTPPIQSNISLNMAPTSGTMNYWRCPKHNCQLKIVTYESMQDAVIDKLEVDSLDVDYNGGKK